MAACGAAVGQDLTSSLADAYFDLPETALGDFAGFTFKGGFDYGIGASATYNSNLRLEEDGGESDILLSLTPWLAYSSDPDGGARYSFDARYSPSLRHYLDNSELNDIDHDFSAAFRIALPRTSVGFYGSYRSISASDRFAGGFVDGTILRYGARASYQLAPRTSIAAGFSAGSTSYDSGGREGADVYSFRLSGSWAANERWSLGPSLRYSVTESELTGKREAWAVMGNVRYSLGERIDLAASLGVEFVGYSRGGGGSEPRLTGSLNASYWIDERWSWSGSVRYATIPSPTTRNYAANDLTFSTAITRQLQYGSLGAGLSLSFSDYEAVGPVTESRGSEEHLSVFLTWSRPLFSERVAFSSSVRWSVNNGRRDWEQLLVTCGIAVAF